MKQTEKKHRRTCAKAARRGRPWSGPLSFALAALMLLSVLPASIVYALDTDGAGGAAAVESFGEYTDAVQVAQGTSHEDAAALLPASIPAVIAGGREQPYTEDVPVVWSCGDYAPETQGTYIFTAAFAQEGWAYAGDMPTASVTVSGEDAPAQGEPPQEATPQEPPPQEKVRHALTFTFGGPLSVSKTQHADFANYSAEQQRQVFAADVRVTDENGLDVGGLTVDFGAFGVEAEAGTVFTVVYSAQHPVTAEVFTAEREVRLADEEPAQSAEAEPPPEAYASVSRISAAADMAAVYSGECGPAGNPSAVTWTFTTASGVLEISGTGPMRDYNNDPPWHEYKDSNGNPHHLCPDVKTIIIGDGVTHIGNYAFPVFGSLTSVTIPSSVTSIGAYAFRGASSLTDIRIPDEVTSIGNDAFRDNASLTHVNIPAGLRVISASTFAACASLPSIVIPAHIETIENDAFGGCGKLSSIVFHNPNPPNQRAFNSLPNAGKFYFPAGADAGKWDAWQPNVDGIKFWSSNFISAADEMPPTLSNGTAVRESESAAEVSFVSSEAGEYYYARVPHGNQPPTVPTAGEGTDCGAGKTTFDLGGLGAGDEVDVYVVVKDANGNESPPLKIEVGDYLVDVTVEQPPHGAINGGGGAEEPGGPWAIGSRHELVAVPDDGYHFAGYTVTGGGASIDYPSSPSAALTVGTSDTTVTARFETNAVTLNLRLDGTPFIRYGDRFKFGLGKSGSALIEPAEYDQTTATETFTAVPNGDYTVYVGATAAGRAPTDITLTVSDGAATATVNFYTLTVRTAPLGAGTASGGGVFLAGTNAGVEAQAEHGAFKRWAAASGASGMFDDAEDANAVYTVNGTAALTAYFMQTDGDGTGLTITPPPQDARKTAEDNQTIDVAAKAALGAGDADNTVQISSLQWFRERVNSPLAAPADRQAFEARYAAARAADGTDGGAISAEGFGGDALAADTKVTADKNGRYWFMVTFTSGDEDVSVTKIDYVDIKNIFTPYEIRVKHTVTAENPADVPTDNSLAYTPAVNTLGGAPGIPFDLNGDDVVTGLPQGLFYDTVVIEGLAAYSGTAPLYSGAYDFEIAGRGKDTPLTLTMNGAFLQNTDCDMEASVHNPHLYTIRYAQDTDMWVTLRAFRVDPAKNPMQTDAGVPGSVLAKGYQDFAAPLDAAGEDTISHFKEEGGKFIPRDVLKWEDNSHQDYLTWAPVGWYIATEPVDFSAGGFNPFEDKVVGGVTYHAQRNWRDFDLPALTLDDPVTEDTEYRPLADGEKLYLVCYGDTGTARVWEEYYLYKRDEDVGAGYTGDWLGKAATFDLLNPSFHDYRRTTAKTDVPGYVAVGYRIVKAADWDNVKELPQSDPNSLASKKPALFHFTPQANPLKDMWGSVTVEIKGADLIDSASAKYGNRPHVVYYYAPDANGNGIPDCGEYEITLNYIGVKADGTETALRETEYLRPRLSPLAENAANATIYVGLDGRMYWTNSGSFTLLAPDGTTSGVTVNTNNLGAAGFEGAGYGSTLTEIEAAGGGGAKWLLRGDSQLIPVTIPKTTGAALTLNFYYDYATDGVSADASKYITEKYRDVRGGPIGVDDTRTLTLKSAAYSRAIPAQEGRLTVGWYEGGDFPGAVPAAGQSEIDALMALAAFHRSGTASIGAREELTASVTFIYSPLSGDVDGDGLKNGDEAPKGGDPFKPDTDGDGMPDGWEADNGLDPSDGVDAGEDADGDGLNNRGEYHSDTDPHDPDTDDDGLPDGWEVEHVLDPKDDGGTNRDNGADGDPDGDGWTNLDEYNGGEGGADPHTAEKRVLYFDANGGLQAPAPMILPAGGGYTVTLPGAGAMRREGYVFVNWCPDLNGHGTLYRQGDSLTLNRGDGKEYEDSDMTLYAVWDIAPRVALNTPFIHGDGSVTLSGRVTRTMYNYRAELAYRQAGGGEWITLDSKENESGDSFFEKVLPAAALKRDTLYEVRLTAANANSGGREVSETQPFLVPSPAGPGSGDVGGEVKNETDELIDVVVSLQRGNIAIQSVLLEGIEFGESVTPRTYKFIGVADGWYSVVAFDGEYTITSNVHMLNGSMVKTPEIIVFTKGKTQSRVVVEPGSPVAVTAEGLPQLFAPSSPLYTESDRLDVVDVGGTVEMRLEASAIEPTDETALDLAAAQEQLKQVLFIDLSVFKTLRDANEALIDNIQLHDELPAMLSITVPTGGRWIAKVYRMHGGPAEGWEPDEQNADGEYFEQPSADTVILHMNKFSGYGLAMDNAFTVSATAAAGGTVTPELKSYFAGEPVSVTATASPGYVFDRWTVTGSGPAHTNASIAAFAMPAQNVTLHAEFVTAEAAADSGSVITALAEGGGGAISPAGKVAVPFGSAQSFTFEPDDGYHVAAVKVNNIPLAGSLPGSYTFTGVYSNQRITVSFAENAYAPGGVPNGEAAAVPPPEALRGPQTGDGSNMDAWLAVWFVSVQGLACTVLWWHRSLRQKRRPQRGRG